MPTSAVKAVARRLNERIVDEAVERGRSGDVVAREIVNQVIVEREKRVNGLGSTDVIVVHSEV